MDSSQEPTTTLQPVPTPSSKRSKKLAIIIFIITVVLLLLFAGGAYYYFQEYQPAQYAKAAIPIYDQIRSQQLGTGNLNRSNTYEEVLAILDQNQTSFTQANDKLSHLKPSPINNAPSFLTNTQRSQQVQEDFTKILKIFSENVSKAKKQTQFMIKVKQLFLLLRPDLTTYPPKAVPAGQPVHLTPLPSTVGELLADWEPRIPKAKAVAKDLFSEPINLGDISFDQLKLLWQETEQGFDALISFLKKQDPKLSQSKVQKIIPENEKEIFAKVDKIDKFLPLLESVLIKNTAESLLRYHFEIDNAKKEELETRFTRLDNNIKQLKEKYSASQ